MIPREVIKIAVSAGWNPFRDAAPIRLEFEHRHFVTVFSEGEGIMVYIGDIAIDPTFWEAIDAWLREHRTSPGAVKLAVSYMEAVIARRDVRAFWERTFVDVPIRREPAPAEVMEWPTKAKARGRAR
jgi:hypothetical protein